jgi:hypothetical protein
VNHETDLRHESGEERIAIADEREVHQDRKPWVTPVVSESPVNELTAASFLGVGADNVFYS